MIRGIGSDLVRISRIERVLERHSDRFAHRILTPDEHKSWAARGYITRFIACRWAAKEAAAKALGTGIRRGVGFQQIHVGNNDLGAPLLRLTGAAAERLGRLGAEEALVTITDDGDYAFAVVIVQ